MAPASAGLASRSQRRLGDELLADLRLDTASQLAGLGDREFGQRRRDAAGVDRARPAGIERQMGNDLDHLCFRQAVFTAQFNPFRSTFLWKGSTMR